MSTFKDFAVSEVMEDGRGFPTGLLVDRIGSFEIGFLTGDRLRRFLATGARLYFE